MRNPQELQHRLRLLITACGGPDRPSRQKLASELRRLADEVMVREAKKDLSKLPGFESLKGLSKAEQEEILFRALADNAAESRRLKKKVEEAAKGLHKKLRQAARDPGAIRRKVLQVIEDEDVDDGEWEWYEGYSGRGMYGEASPLALSFSERWYSPNSTLGKKLKALGFAADNLGMGFVYYLR